MFLEIRLNIPLEVAPQAYQPLALKFTCVEFRTTTDVRKGNVQWRQETYQPCNAKQRSQHQACSNTNPEEE